MWKPKNLLESNEVSREGLINSMKSQRIWKRRPFEPIFMVDISDQINVGHV